MCTLSMIWSLSSLSRSVCFFKYRRYLNYKSSTKEQRLSKDKLKFLEKAFPMSIFWAYDILQCIDDNSKILQEVQKAVDSSNTCDTHDRNRHKTRADHHCPKFHINHMICIQYIANDTS